MRINFDIKLTKSQQEAYNTAHRKDLKYLTLVWSRQSGKSTLMKVLCIEWLFGKNERIAYICRNYILAKKIYKDISQYIPKQFIKSSNGTDLIIETTLGSTLQLFSAESGDSLRGQTFTYLICDEFAFFKFEQTSGSHLWNDILFPTMKVSGKLTIFVSTPLGKQNLFFDMYMKGIDENYPTYYSIMKDIYSDGLITNEEIEEIKKNVPPLSFQQEFLCQFLSNASSVFPEYDNCFKDKFKFNNSKTWIGIDPSTVGEDDTVVTVINQENQVIQHNIIGDLDSKYKQIASLVNKYNPVGTYIESNSIGTPIINEITKLLNKKTNVMPFQTTNETKKQQVGMISVSISNNDIAFDSNNKILYQQLGTYGFSITKSGNITYAATGNNHDDYISSLGLALQAKQDFITYNNVSFYNQPKRNIIR